MHSLHRAPKLKHDFEENHLAYDGIRAQPSFCACSSTTSAPLKDRARPLTMSLIA